MWISANQSKPEVQRYWKFSIWLLGAHFQPSRLQGVWTASSTFWTCPLQQTLLVSEAKAGSILQLPLSLASPMVLVSPKCSGIHWNWAAPLSIASSGLSSGTLTLPPSAKSPPLCMTPSCLQRMTWMNDLYITKFGSQHKEQHWPPLNPRFCADSAEMLLGGLYPNNAGVFLIKNDSSSPMAQYWVSQQSKDFTLVVYDSKFQMALIEPLRDL